jgi:hypothetical protein
MQEPDPSTIYVKQMVVSGYSAHVTTDGVSQTVPMVALNGVGSSPDNSEDRIFNLLIDAHEIPQLITMLQTCAGLSTEITSRRN